MNNSNETPAGNASNDASIGSSVVQDLMRVYENLTQSSTPQIPGVDESAPYDPQHQHQLYSPSQSSQQHMPGQTSTNYNIPPPIYHMPGQPPPTYAPTPVQTQGLAAQQFYNDPAYAQPPYIASQGQHQHPGYGIHEQQTSSAHHQQDDDSREVQQEPAETSGRSRRKRRYSDDSSKAAPINTKGRKKSKSSDARWSKRFTWPEDLHRDFVSAIFDVGLKHSSPSTIQEHMPKHEQITTERIKSHLQKYRLHRVKSKKEFISSYESSLRNFNARGGVQGMKAISGGEVAAHLSFATSTGKDGSGSAGDTEAGGSKGAVTDASANLSTVASSSPVVVNPSAESGTSQGNDALMLPQLTEAEKASPIGAAMGYLMGLFFSLKQQLVVQRAMEAGEGKSKSPVQDVFNSFVAGSAPGAAPAGADQGEAHRQPEVLSAPSVRTNIEENSMMKREMQNQMALQNKMRALKQQELNKYKSAGEEHNDKEGHDVEEASKAGEASRLQGAGETAGNDGAEGSRGRHRGLSIGASDEFWNTDVVDEQLFEFLMNN